jgi:hypothetical protein
MSLLSDGNTLFGEGVNSSQVVQGSLRDCSFLSACAALADEPEQISAIFSNVGDGFHRFVFHG